MRLYGSMAEHQQETGRKGDWQQTYTGRQIWPLDMRPEDIVLEDVAHHLALENRFLGATREPYSVAEHSVRVCDLVVDVLTRRRHLPITPSVARVGLRALLHDGSEYCLRDLPRPTKMQPEIAIYREVWERDAMRAICARFELDEDEPEIVIEADARLLVTEKRDLLRPSPAPWTLAQGRGAIPLPDTIEPWGWRVAEIAFTERFTALDRIRRA